MEEIQFTNAEIDVLLSFIGISSLFDVKKQSDFTTASQVLIQKGYLDSGILPNKNTLTIVETFRIYEEADTYLRFQDAVIALGNHGMCVIKKTILGEETDTHLFHLLNIKTLFHILYTHPVPRYFDPHVPKMKLIPCQFILVFYKEHQIDDYLQLEYDGTSWFHLDEKYNKDTQIEEMDGLQWLLERLPKSYLATYQDFIEEVTT